jgi:CO/xanthine dehydrogenase FAD-binding subunit
MTAHEFDYIKPTELNDALALLAEHGPQARLLAGGTDLALKLKEGAQTPEVVIDLKGLDELRRLEVDQGTLVIGALVTFTQLLDSPLAAETVPMLRDAASTVGSVGIRNRATLVGNICSAVPSLDSGPALLVHEASVHVRSAAGERRMPIADWFVGPKQAALQADEIVTSLTIPLPEKKTGACYVKLGRYAAEDLAQAGVGLLVLDGLEYRVAFCAVGPIPKRAASIETVLNGRELTEAAIAEAQALIPQEISPITDIRSSQEYRELMTTVMFERGLHTAAARLSGEQPEYGAVWV